MRALLLAELAERIQRSVRSQGTLLLERNHLPSAYDRFTLGSRNGIEQWTYYAEKTSPPPSRRTCRARTGISYALTEAMDEGHCGLPTGELVRPRSCWRSHSS
jgi:hypothetical protein